MDGGSRVSMFGGEAFGQTADDFMRLIKEGKIDEVQKFSAETRAGLRSQAS
jgi:hypothetical protein